MKNNEASYTRAGVREGCLQGPERGCRLPTGNYTEEQKEIQPFGFQERDVQNTCRVPLNGFSNKNNDNMAYYFLKSVLCGKKAKLMTLPGQSHRGLPLLVSVVEDREEAALRYPVGTVFCASSLVSCHKGHASWYEARNVKVLSEDPVEVFDKPEEGMTAKWEEYAIRVSQKSVF